MQVAPKQIFYSPEGKSCQPNSWANRVYRPIMRAVHSEHLDIPELSSLDMRHTAAILNALPALLLRISFFPLSPICVIICSNSTNHERGSRYAVRIPSSPLDCARPSTSACSTCSCAFLYSGAISSHCSSVKSLGLCSFSSICPILPLLYLLACEYRFL